MREKNFLPLHNYKMTTIGADLLYSVILKNNKYDIVSC